MLQHSNIRISSQMQPFHGGLATVICSSTVLYRCTLPYLYSSLFYLYSTALCSTRLCSSLLYFTRLSLLHSTLLLYSSPLYSATLYSTSTRLDATRLDATLLLFYVYSTLLHELLIMYSTLP
jgi:hypothetical protein